MRPRLLAMTTAALVVLPATAALAHPSFNPNAVPVGQPVETVLVVPHGCAPGGGMPDGDAVPTTRVDLGHTTQVVLEARDVDGWDHRDDGEAIVWTDAGGATTEPIELPVTLTVTEGSEGDEVFLPAFQECEDGSTFRWVATPGEDGFPAVRIELTAGATDTVEVDDSGHDMEDMEDMATSEAMTDMPSEAEPTSDEPADTEAAASTVDDDGGSGTMWIVLVAVLLAAGIAIAVRSRRST